MLFTDVVAALPVPDSVAPAPEADRSGSLSIGGITAVYFDIEVEKGTFRSDAKDPTASTTAAAVGFAAEFRQTIGSAAWIEGVVRGTWRLLGPAGASDTVPGVGLASRPCVREGCAVSLDPSGPAIVDVAALGRTV